MGARGFTSKYILEIKIEDLCQYSEELKETSSKDSNLGELKVVGWDTR